MGSIYKVEIGFPEGKHCLKCPMRNREDDSCNYMQEPDGENLQYACWADQMAGCPLKFVREVN